MKRIITIQHTQSLHHTNGRLDLGQTGSFQSLEKKKLLISELD